MPRVLYREIRFHVIDHCLRDTSRRYHLCDIAEACNKVLFDAFGVKVSLRTVQYDLSMLQKAPFNIELNESLRRINVYRYADILCAVPFLTSKKNIEETCGGKIYQLRVPKESVSVFERELLAFATDVEVLAPDDLRQQFRARLTNALKRYEQNN